VELELDPDLLDRLTDLARRSGRSLPEIIQGLISNAFPLPPAETDSF
jgi:predicted transcriptional regulator